jgi:hypothetical protein
MIAETISINGNNNEPISAYVARPLGAGPFPGARVAVELTLESAKELSVVLARAIVVAEIVESERLRGT